jgi:hypothetical protein
MSAATFARALRHGVVLALLGACGTGGGEAPGAAPATSPATRSTAGVHPANPDRCPMSDPIVTVLTSHELSSLTSSRGKGRQALAGSADATQRLLEIARDRACTADLRFRAFEAYFALAATPTEPDAMRSAVAGFADQIIEVYVAALAGAAYPNRWGLPSGVTSSPTSRRLIALGAPAAAALTPLFSDQRELAYEGSEEATIASRHHLRVKDLAAALVAAIRGVAFVEDPAPAARDAAIARLASDRGSP